MKRLLEIPSALRDLVRGPGSWTERTERNADVLIFVVLAVGLILRLIFLSAFHEELTTRKENGFYYPAYNFTQGQGLGIAAECPTSYRAPLYIFFLIPFMAIFGSDYAWPLGLAQMVVSLVSVYLVYLIGKEWRSKRVGLIGAAFMAIYPYNLYHDTQFYITFLFTFLLLLTVLGMLKLERSPSKGRAVLNGLWIGLAMLATSGPMAFFAPLACVWLWRSWGSFKKALGYAAIMAATALLVMTPWFIRNYQVHKTFVPLTTDAGRVFFKAYNPLAMHMMLNDLWVDATPEPEDRAPTPYDGIGTVGCGFMNGYTETQSDDFWLGKASAWVSANPDKVPELLSMKAVLLWHPWLYPPKGAVGGNGAIILSAAFMNWGYALSYGFLLTLAAFEVIISTREDRKRTWLFLLLAVAFTLTYVITVPGTKYRVPFDSIMAIMAASSLWRFHGAWLQYRKRTEP